MIFSNHIKSLSKVALLLLWINLNIGKIEAQKNKEKASESSQVSKQEVVIYPVYTNYTLGSNLSAVQLKYSFSHQVFDIHDNTLIAVNKEGTLGIFLSPELALSHRTNSSYIHVADLRDGYIMKTIEVGDVNNSSITKSHSFTFANNDSAIYFFTGSNFQEFNFYSGEIKSYFNWPEDWPCKGYEQIGENIYFWYTDEFYPWKVVRFYKLSLLTKTVAQFVKYIHTNEGSRFNKLTDQSSVSFFNNLYRNETDIYDSELDRLDFVRLLATSQGRKILRDEYPGSKSDNVYSTLWENGIELIRFDSKSDSFTLMGAIKYWHQMPNGEFQGAIEDEELVGMSNEIVLAKYRHKLVIYPIDSATLLKNTNERLFINYVNPEQLDGGSNVVPDCFRKAHLNLSGDKVIFDYAGYYDAYYSHHWIYSIKDNLRDTFTNPILASELKTELERVYDDIFNYESLQKTKLETDLDYNSRVNELIKTYKVKYYTMLDSLSKTAYPIKNIVMDLNKGSSISLENYDADNELLRIPINTPDGNYYSLILPLKMSLARNLFNDSKIINTKVYLYYNYLTRKIEPYKFTLLSDSLKWDLFLRTPSYILAKNFHLIDQSKMLNCRSKYFETTFNSLQFMDTNVLFNWLSLGKPKKYLYTTGYGSFKINIVDAINSNFKLQKNVNSDNSPCHTAVSFLDCRDIIEINGSHLLISNDVKINIDEEVLKQYVNIPSHLSVGLATKKGKVLMQLTDLQDAESISEIDITRYFETRNQDEEMTVPHFSFSPNGKYICMEIGNKLVVYTSNSLKKLFQCNIIKGTVILWDAHSRYISMGTNELDQWIIPVGNMDE